MDTKRASVVVIGGGVAGASVAFHLANSGLTDVVLVEKRTVTSGATSHAVGAVTHFSPSRSMMHLRRYSIGLYRELGVFTTSGSVRIASDQNSLLELKRGASRARGLGLEVELIGPDEVVCLLPGASRESLLGGMWIANDGFLDPYTATTALVDSARRLGVRLVQGTRVTAIELGSRHEVRAVVTERGRIETERVVNAAGLWAPRVSAMVGAFTPAIPIEHQHMTMALADNSPIAPPMPIIREPATLSYGKVDPPGMIVGGWETNPVARWSDGAPWEHGGRSLAPDYERFAPLLEAMERRFPFLERAVVVHPECHPDGVTPDGNPLLGPVPGVTGFWMAAGLSFGGFGVAGGLGKTLAEWLTTGETEFETHGYAPWRFGRIPYDDVPYLTEAAREVYRFYYHPRYPYDNDEWGRPKRLSALHHRLQELGAVFGVKNGWERADYFRPKRRWRRAGADQHEFGFTKPPYFERLREESTAFRERVGMIDLSSFGKLEISGPGALALLERVCDSRIDRKVGRVVYTQMLNSKGGIVADVTVTRLAEDCFRMITGAAFVPADLGWLRFNLNAGDDKVELSDRSDEIAVIGLWGPRSAEVIRAVCEADISPDVFPFYTACEFEIEGLRVLGQRVSYVGEFGLELYMDRADAVQVWDRLFAAGRAEEISPCGYRVLDSLRLEKGYRYMGVDLTSRDNPYEAGLDFCVSMEKGNFIGREVLERVAAAGPTTRLRTLVVGDDEEYVPIYGGEAVYSGDRVVGRLRSAAYGFTCNRNIALAYLPAGLEVGHRAAIDVFGDRIAAEVAPDALHDPEHTRARGLAEAGAA
jgi:4-methylaminobutanoate oxidase (formaldehyde-forming)